MGLVGKYILIQMHDALLSNDITDQGNDLAQQLQSESGNMILRTTQKE